jgi:hypothetical protein
VWGRGVEIDTVVIDSEAIIGEDRRNEMDGFTVEILSGGIHDVRSDIGGHV